MRLFWLVWLARHFGEFGYSRGPLHGAIGTAATLFSALLLGYALRRHEVAALAAGAVVGVGGITWLALH
ncbi:MULTISPECIES: hypothetical protein [unclassified Streptomyces]|uniref:hypothetical protein n=1 Tax=unclassified Streptomyces TaxID=2593676 RepID=UPI002E0D12BE|nr:MULTISPECIES: hypothetical protein [unclassified Streptomyces]WSR27062.1 hypothetical protein OG573_13610 [Streptomyces sp. NBC_01205]